ncbi:FAD binding domain protein [Nemania sp. FL0031]|nr:FAD binding domain protein [Nemania sp. FL0031]
MRQYSQVKIVVTFAQAKPLLPYASSPLVNSYIQSTDACSAIFSVLPNQLFWPNSSQYMTEANAIWSETCLRTPSCVFEPNTAQDLSKGIILIKRSRSKFAVRSGGHMPVPGAQSLDNGVMISLSKFNAKTLNEDKSIASIGPGQTWFDVYDWLGKESLAVNGGRYPSVGVGGVLLGGGIGYFSGKRGWSCDDIVAYEIVLADGRIVNVTAGEANGPNSVDPSTNGSKTPDFSDLFWALKGGHNNFGIVVRFDMRTFPVGPAFGGFTSWSGSAHAEFFGALNAYMAPGGGVDDPNSAINAFASVVPANGSASYTLANVALYPGDNPHPEALHGFSSIHPSFQTMAETSVYNNWIEVPKLLSAYSGRGTRNLFWTIAYKGDPRAISIHNTTVIDGALRELSHVRGLIIYATWQPISKGWLEVSQRGGGDALALDPEEDGTFIAGMITSMWEDESDDDTVYSFVERAAQTIQTETEKLGLFNPFVYLNDAAKTQKPYETLGHGKSLPKLRRIQNKYDPEGFLQDYLHHGFPLR